MRVNDIFVAPHFKLREFECPCCGLVKIHPELVDRLERLRALWKEPLFVTSGYRCQKHNREVGGVPHSMHMEGKAADVVVLCAEQNSFVDAAYEAGFFKALPYGSRNFVHLAVSGREEGAPLPLKIDS